MKRSSRFQIVLILVVSVLSGAPNALSAEDRLIQSIDVSTPVMAPDDGTYWMQARPGFIPPIGASPAKAVITLQKIDRVGTHMYHGLAAMWSTDLGKTWTAPEEIKSLDRVTRDDGIMDAFCDMVPKWHKKTGKLLVTGVDFLEDPKIHHDPPRGPGWVAYAVYDPKTDQWGDRQRLDVPDQDDKFYMAWAGCTQRIDLPDGDILLPIYFYAKGPEEVNYVTVLRCGFDGTTLTYKEHGSELTADLKAKRIRTGLYEPSLTRFHGKYFLTLRADAGAYVSTSDDGLHFTDPKPWTFDDDLPLGSYNTQQHWVTHSDGLYLSYTRKGANNDAVFRHRAPLFIARVDPEKLVVERATERIVLPNLGEDFGNWGVCNVTPEETWIVDPLRKAPPGKPSVFLSKIRWSRPNRLFENN